MLSETVLPGLSVRHPHGEGCAEPRQVALERNQPLAGSDIGDNVEWRGSFAFKVELDGLLKVGYSLFG